MGVKPCVTLIWVALTGDVYQCCSPHCCDPSKCRGVAPQERQREGVDKDLLRGIPTA